MKNFIPNSIGGLLMIFIVMLFQTGCISENSEFDQPLDPNMDLEKVTDYSDAFPLENLRMNPATLKMLAELRAATAKYHRIEVAMEDGYALGSECVSVPGLGGMGFHYVNFGLVDGTYDPTQPEALLYEMNKNGKMRLVAVEFIVVKQPWDFGHMEIPHFGSQIFDEAFAPNPLPFDNYQLHVWIWKNNPSEYILKVQPECAL